MQTVIGEVSALTDALVILRKLNQTGPNDVRDRFTKTK